VWFGLLGGGHRPCKYLSRREGIVIRFVQSAQSVVGSTAIVDFLYMPGALVAQGARSERFSS